MLSGHKIAGVKFRILDGMHHSVDSSEFAFFQAAQGAVRDVFESGSWQLLEPIMLVEVTGPIEFQVRRYTTVHMVKKFSACIKKKSCSRSLHDEIFHTRVVLCRVK